MNHGSAERREYLRELKALTPLQREAILKRDNHTCQIPDCGARVSLEVHHIDGSCLECIITAVRPRFIDTGASKRKIFTIELVEQQ